LKPETKFYQKVKENFKKLSLIRIENLSVPGVPDLLIYNTNGRFFTLELKVTKTNKIRFSPHQIGVNDARSKTPKLYEGSRIRELDACGLSLEPMLQGFPSILNYFLQLES
jgi:hypothetical protein